MCELCLATGGHAPGCPYYRSPYPIAQERPTFTCRLCGKGIYRGEVVVDVAEGEDFVHANCLSAASHTELIQTGLVLLHRSPDGGVCEVCGKPIAPNEEAVDIGYVLHTACLAGQTGEAIFNLFDRSPSEYGIFD